MVYGLSNGHVTQSTPNTQSVCYRNYFQDTENWPLFRCMLECYFVMVLMMYLMCVMIRMHLWPPVVCTKAQQWQRQVVNWSYLQRCWRYSKKMDIAFSSSHRWGLIAVPSFVSRLQKYMLSFLFIPQNLPLSSHSDQLASCYFHFIGCLHQPAVFITSPPRRGNPQIAKLRKTPFVILFVQTKIQLVSQLCIR